MSNSFAKLYVLDPSPRARRHEPDRHQGMDKPGAHLFWVQSGKGTLQAPGRLYPVEPGPRCWLVDMKKPRTYAPLPGKRIVNAGFRFGGPDLEAWREEMGEESQFTLDQRDFKFIRQSVQQLSLLARRRPAGYEWEIHTLITQILGRLLKSRRLFGLPEVNVPKALTRAISVVMADPRRDWKVSELAGGGGGPRGV